MKMGKLRYKGYTGSVLFSEEDDTLYGKVLGLRRDAIIYEGDSIAAIRKDFEDAIDHYLESCVARGVEAEKPFSGRFVIRMTSDLHGQTAERAEELGESINDFINDAIRKALSVAG